MSVMRTGVVMLGGRVDAQAAMDYGAQLKADQVSKSRNYNAIAFGRGPGAKGPCVLRIMAPGIRSSVVAAAVNKSAIVVKRLGEHEGSAISITALAVPPAAKKAYSKGEEFLLRKKYADARKHFEKAIEAYPQYAMAWSELGAALALDRQPDAARRAFVKAIELDRLYLKPLVQLARLEGDLKRWTDCVRAADAALALHPVEFPAAYYYRALAHLNAREWKETVARGRECVEEDTNNEFPRAHLLVAMALEQSGDRDGASEWLANFLRVAPPGPETKWASDHWSRLQAGR